MTRDDSYYTSLGLPIDATQEEIRHAYREAARRLHPDTNEEVGQTELFLEVQQAYDVLSNPVKKIAYDDTIPAVLKKPPEVTLNISYSRTTLPRILEAQKVYAFLEMNVKPDAVDPARPPLNLCLVLDCSTSMQGIQMDTVKSTAIELIHLLRSVDVFSVVVFSDRAEVLVPATIHMDPNQAETRIRMLHPHGGTEIYQGLEKGFAEVQRFQSRKYKNHIILLTDGRTYGDEEQSITLAQRAAEMGITISGLGIGSKWNDIFLDALASATGGNCEYVPKPKDIRKYLKDLFNSFNNSYANHVLINFTTGENAQLRDAFRLEPEAAPLDTISPMRLGSLPCDSVLSVLLEFEVGNIPAATGEVVLMEGWISLAVPSQDIPSTSLRLKLIRTTSSNVLNEMPSTTIVQAMSRLNLYRLQERARKDVGDGRIHDATHRLHNIATQLLAQGNQELARKVMAEANYVQKHLAFSEDGEKNLKYSTRGLLLPNGIEDKRT